ncbi:MAG: ribonucleoside-diphosphate reductase subunit alpha, partial [Candidatus Omnitrophica bacterium]|nr:ribonucleoside-diphosphate reductase subunit alpha [Candidatus Omnitrophota bacterium]
GLRNSLLLAIAPTATIASIVGCYEAIEPQVSNLFKRETMSGEFLQVNKYLVATLKEMNLWNDEIRNQIKMGNGSIQHIEEIPQEIRDQYRTVWEYSMKSLIDLAAGRGPFLDQSQSLNLFQESPNIGKLSSMYFYAWQKGLKTTYYLRSRPATEIKKTTVGQKSYTTTEAVACSLENPEECEACQ